MSLKDLLDIDVTTVSRRPEPATDVPAAVFVITAEDILRAGATSIPEALRLAPGVQVARIDGGTWAIGIRGFADRLSRAVLVMIDGRAVYSPLFAGTYWESQDTALADIDHIEVIRGPGGTLWGANAVDGIINIITKKASDTQGLLAGGGAGTEDKGFGGFRYGGTSGSLSYRAYFKALDRGSEYHTSGPIYDGWKVGLGGFRGDWTLKNNRTFTLQGDAYDGRLGALETVTTPAVPFKQVFDVDAPISGGNILARFAGTGRTSDFQLQMYYDRTNRREMPVAEDRDTIDLDFQQTFRGWRRNVVTYGLGYRVTDGRITAIAPTAFTPDNRTDNLYSAFVQDEIALVPNRVRFIAGSKLEHNDYSGFELQPSGRLLWTPDAVNTLWSAVTRAVRTPSRVETDYTTLALNGTSPLPIFVRLLPNPKFMPEELVAYEVGYRVRPGEHFFATISGFYNNLQHTLSTELETPFVEQTPSPTHFILPVVFGNGLHGNSQGVEVTTDLRPTSWWRLTGNYSYIHLSMSRNPGSDDVSNEAHLEGTIPNHQAQAQSSFDLGRWSFDWLVRYVSKLKQGPVPSYATSDLRIGFRPSPRLELSIVGQDLFQDRHLEWLSGTGLNVEVQRSVYARVIWQR